MIVWIFAHVQRRFSLNDRPAPGERGGARGGTAAAADMACDGGGCAYIAAECAGTNPPWGRTLSLEFVPLIVELS